MSRIIFVDDDETDLSILQRALRPVSSEWDTVFVSSGREALQKMAEASFDVVVSDMQMPEMDGVQLLEQVMALYPDMVRIILSSVVEEETKLRAIKAAHIWMAKPCDIEFLKNVVDRTGAWADFLRDPPLKQLIGRMRSLPSLPHLYLKLGEELRSPDASFRSIGDIVAHDVAMTANILHMANSAFFGLRNPVSSVEQAVSILGLAMIRTLVLSAGIFSQFDIGKQKGFSAEGLMSHSLATAGIARMIAKTEGGDRAFSEEVFTAGMLHDVGKLLLAHEMPEEYERALTMAHEEDLPVWRAEKAVFGSTHAHVGAYLLALWGIADGVVEASAYHHNPSGCTNRRFSALTAVHVADMLEYAEDCGAEGSKTPEVDQAYLKALNMDNRLEEWMEAGRTLFHAANS